MESVKTTELLKACNINDQVQQDCSEFQILLTDHLENQMKESPEKLEHFKHLFYGEKESVIKCTQVNYESASKETFTNLSVHM